VSFDIHTQSRERIRVTQEQAEAELQGEVAKGKRMSMSLESVTRSLEESEKKAAGQARTIETLLADLASLQEHNLEIKTK
jgi:hypothetical protein